MFKKYVTNGAKTGSNDGMNTLEQCLQDLIDNNKITIEEGMGKASNPKVLIQN